MTPPSPSPSPSRSQRLLSQLARARVTLLVVLCLVYVASWPGSPQRTLVLETGPVLAPVPAEVRERDGALDVVVTAKDGGAPIPGAKVRAFAVLDGKAYGAGEAVTDPSGVARLVALPRAEHWIVAEAAGRARASQMVAVEAGARRLDLALGPEHVLDVQVRTEAGEPVMGAELEVRGADPFPVGARTDAKGFARIGRLGDAPWVVVARASGFEEVTRRRVPEGTPLVLTLGRQGALAVRVVGEGGEPVPGARVLVASPSLFPARVTETNDKGSVRVSGLAPGSYALRATKGGRVSPIEIGVPVGKGEEREVELRLAPGVTITARVVEATTRDPVPSARVTLVEGGLSPFPIEAVSDKQGRAVLGPFARGAASIAARADGFVARGAVAVPEAPPPEVEVALVRGGRLLGRVVDARGYPVDGATVRVVGTDLDGMPVDEDPQRTSFREAHFQSALAGPSPLLPAGELGVMPGPVPPIPRGGASGLPLAAGARGQPGQAAQEEPWTSARDGTFEAKPVTPGRVRALVHHPQYVEATSEVVQLSPDGEAKVTVVLQRGGILEGRVADSRGRGVANAHVTVLSTRGTLERVTRTASDGTFAFAALPEALTVLVSRDEDVTQVAARAEVTVPEGGKQKLELVIPEPRPALPVRVTGGRRALDAAQISAVSLDATEGARVTAFTDARGDASLANVRGLPLRVEVRAPGHAAKVVLTTPSQERLDVELAPAESLTGEIWANRRETIEGADVTLQTESGTRHARTNKDGVFTLGDLSPGTARLRVRAKGRAALDKTVEVEARGGRRATEIGKLELAEAGVVEGVVVDGRGDPVPGARVAQGAVPTYLPVGVVAPGIVSCDGRGRFRLEDLAEGTVTLEAYAPDVGRARVAGVRVVSGRTTDRVRIVLVRDPTGGPNGEPTASGGVAVTLGETAAGLEGPEVVVAAVAEGSEAERGGLLPNDVLLEVAGARVSSMATARARLSGPVHDDVVVRVRRGDRVLLLRVAREQVRR